MGEGEGGAGGPSLSRQLTPMSQKISGHSRLDAYVIEALKGNMRIINPNTNQLSVGEGNGIITIAEYYKLDTRKIDGENLNEYHERLIDEIARKQWEIYVHNEKSREDSVNFPKHAIDLRPVDKGIIDNYAKAVNVDQSTWEGWESFEKSGGLPPQTTGREIPRGVFKAIEEQISTWMIGKGDGDRLTKSWYDPNKINVSTRKKIYEIYLSLSDKFKGASIKGILALTLLLSYGYEFFEGIIDMLETLQETMETAIDQGAGPPEISEQFELRQQSLSSTRQGPHWQWNRVTAEVPKLLTELSEKIKGEPEKYMGIRESARATIDSLDSLESLPLIDATAAEILKWGAAVPAKAPKATYLSSILLKPNPDVNMGVATSSSAAGRRALGKHGVDSASSDTFALLEALISDEAHSVTQDYFNDLLGVLEGGLVENIAENIIKLFVLFSLLKDKCKMLVINRLKTTPGRKLNTPEGRAGIPLPRINQDEWFLGFLGIDYNSRSHNFIVDYLSGLGEDKKERIAEYNEQLWGAYLREDGNKEEFIGWLDGQTNGGFRKALKADEKEKINEKDAKTDLWIRDSTDDPWIPVSPEVIFDVSLQGYKNPEEILAAMFPNLQAQKTRRALKKGSMQWNPLNPSGVGQKRKPEPEPQESPLSLDEYREMVLEERGKMRENKRHAAFQKKKKKKKKPIRTRNRGKHKKPSKRETLAERTMRLRRKKQSRKRKQEKKEKKSKKRKKTNRNRKNDRIITIGDSVEIHYN